MGTSLSCGKIIIRDTRFDNINNSLEDLKKNLNKLNESTKKLNESSKDLKKDIAELIELYDIKFKNIEQLNKINLLLIKIKNNIDSL